MKQPFHPEERLYRSLPDLPGEARSEKLREILAGRGEAPSWRPLRAAVKDAELAAILVAQSRDPDPARRRVATLDLAFCGRPAARERLREIVLSSEERANMRAAAAMAPLVGAWREAEAIWAHLDALEAVLGDEEATAGVRGACAVALHAFGRCGALPFRIENLDAFPCGYVPVTALVDPGDERVREMLLERQNLPDPNPHRIDSARALARFGVEVRVEAARIVLLGGAYEGLGFPEQGKAVAMLGAMPIPEAREVLAECILEAQDPRLLLAAARGLRALGGTPQESRVLAGLRELLARDEPEDRAEAVALLEASEPEAAIVFLAEACEDEPDPWLRERMVRAILAQCLRAGEEAFDRGEWGRAALHLDRAAQDPRTAPDPLRRAYAHLRAGNAGRARHLYGGLAPARAAQPHVRAALAYLERAG